MRRMICPPACLPTCLPILSTPALQSQPGWRCLAAPSRAPACCCATPQAAAAFRWRLRTCQAKVTGLGLATLPLPGTCGWRGETQ